MSDQITVIEPKDLMEKTLELKAMGHRIVQLCAVSMPEAYELSYSFALGEDMTTLRFHVAPDEEICSISDIFAPASFYENEIRDLFGVHIRMIQLDYEGNLYRIKTATPFKKS